MKNIRTLAALGVLLSASLTAHAATINVDTTDDQFDESQESPVDCSLREAVESANNNGDFGGCQATGEYGDDTIVVPAGVYEIESFGGCEDDNYQGDIDIHSPVVIQGAGAETTIIDGAGCNVELRAFNSCDRVFDVQAYEGSFEATIRAVTIRNGLPRQCEGEYDVGGGIRNSEDLTLDRVVISGNEAAEGGGVYNSGRLTMVGSTVTDNHARGFVCFNFCDEGQTPCRDGGCIDQSSECDGEVDCEDGSDEDDHCTEGDGRIRCDGVGGGISNAAGGRIVLPPFPEGPQGPQGILLPETMPIINSTISGNTANEEGGGIANRANSIALRNVTITDNRARYGGGGVALRLSGKGPQGPSVNLPSAEFPGQTELIVRNSIIAGNTLVENDGEAFTPDCQAFDFNTLITTEGFNLIGNGEGCPAFVDGVNGDQVGSETQPIDPLLGPLADNGGATPTHALLTDSPAIDSANPAGCFFDDDQSDALLVDQRGLTRPADGDADAGVRCDIGAFELQPLCGNGTTDAGEECDDGNVADGDGCSAACLLEPACGDGTIDAGEECDDGNTVDGDGCSADCANEVVPACGDGILQEGEECDGGSGCNADCTLAPFCGDGVKDAGEECDDGNNLTGDGCSAACLDEAGITFVSGAGCNLVQQVSLNVSAGSSGLGMLGILGASLVSLVVKRRKLR